MAKLDPERAISEIDQFLQVTGPVVPDVGPGIVYLGTVMCVPRPRPRPRRRRMSWSRSSTASCRAGTKRPPTSSVHFSLSAPTTPSYAEMLGAH